MVRSDPYSVNEVITALDALDGKVVSVVGVLQIEFEGDSLWHLPKSERGPGYNSSLWADFDTIALGMTPEQLRAFDGRHVEVCAVVDRHDTGHFGLWPGSLLIRNITKYKAKAT